MGNQQRKTKSNRQFEDNVVWITGGGSGIGRALALEFGKKGAFVVVSGRREARLAEVVSALEGQGGRGLALPCDVTDESQVADAVATIEAECGQLDVAVANAGFSVAGKVSKLSAEDWRRQLDVNVVGLAMTARYASEALAKTRGRLALVGSVASMMPMPNLSAYGASKAAVHAIGQALSIELAPCEVSCTTIHPGFVDSEITFVDNDGVFRAEAKDRRPHQIMWTSERAARVMVQAIYQRKREFIFTAHGKVGVFLGTHFRGLTNAFFRKVPLEKLL